MEGDRSVDLLGLLRGPVTQVGLKVIKVETTDPDPITFTFEGTKQAIDLAIFEVPVDFYPLRKADRILVNPLLDEGASQRWGAVQKINGGITLATMAGPSSLNIVGIDKTYGADDLIIPPYFAVSDAFSHYTDEDIDTHCSGGLSGTSTDNYTHTSNDYLLYTDIRPLKAGDTVSIAPYWDAAVKKVKYVILQLY